MKPSDLHVGKSSAHAASPGDVLIAIEGGCEHDGVKEGGGLSSKGFVECGCEEVFCCELLLPSIWQRPGVSGGDVRWDAREMTRIGVGVAQGA